MAGTAIQHQNLSHYFRAVKGSGRIYKLKHRKASPCYIPSHSSKNGQDNQARVRSTMEPAQSAPPHRDNRYLNSHLDATQLDPTRADDQDDLDYLINEVLSDELTSNGADSREGQKQVFNPWSWDAFLVGDHATEPFLDPLLTKEAKTGSLSSPQDCDYDQLLQLSDQNDLFDLKSPDLLLNDLDLDAIAHGFDADFVSTSPNSDGGRVSSGDNFANMKSQSLLSPEDWHQKKPLTPQFLSPHSDDTRPAHQEWADNSDSLGLRFAEQYDPKRAAPKYANITGNDLQNTSNRGYWHEHTSALSLPPEPLSATAPAMGNSNVAAQRALFNLKSKHRVFQKRGPMLHSSDIQAFGKTHSLSKLPLLDLYACMGLSHDPEEAKRREMEVMSMLEQQGFVIGQQTWIRDTPEPERNRILQHIQAVTKEKWGYTFLVLEAIIRRGTYSRMQTLLRKNRREKEAECDRRD